MVDGPRDCRRRKALHPLRGQAPGRAAPRRLHRDARGRSGGYHLATAPAEIGLGAVLRVLGEPLFDDPGYCERHAGSESDGDCVHRDFCTLRVLWHGLEQVMQCLLDRITFADLLRNDGRIQDLIDGCLGDILGRPEPLLHLLPKSGD